ncbi:MAG: hypothetical protein GY938_32835, partial [Ketobacter sp.]|nr:hypothetical protein [Ketobacter sp.]
PIVSGTTINNADVILNGQSVGDGFGESVASAGDFNGDGKDDVIVGALGSAFIFFGPIVSGTTINNADVILNGQSRGNWFGWSVASAGDFNGDGKDDVIVGAPRNNNTGSFSGSAFIFFGGVTGTINNPGTNADVILNGQRAGDYFGRSVALAGDFNGDGVDDVIVGASENDTNGINSGSAYIFFSPFDPAPGPSPAPPAPPQPPSGLTVTP